MTQGGWRREVMMKGSGDKRKWWGREVVEAMTQGGWRREVMMKGSGDKGKWWRREVVTKGSGDEGKWWRREVTTKGSGDEGKWWRREVVTKGSGDEGKWWRREVWRRKEVVTKGSGDEGKCDDERKWWRREVVTKGSGDEGKWWRREVVTKGSGDEGKWWGRGVVTKGSGEEGEWWGRGVQIALEWLHEGCMGYVLGRKPEHETLCFSVSSGCRRRWQVPRLCGGCGWGRFVRELFLLCVLQRVVVSVCVVLCGSWISGCRLHCNGCMNVAWAMFWGGSGSTKPCVFPCKVAAGDDERYLVCAAGAAGVVLCANCSSYVFCNEWLCLCA